MRLCVPPVSFSCAGAAVTATIAVQKLSKFDLFMRKAQRLWDDLDGDLQASPTPPARTHLNPQPPRKACSRTPAPAAATFAVFSRTECCLQMGCNVQHIFAIRKLAFGVTVGVSTLAGFVLGRCATMPRASAPQSERLRALSVRRHGVASGCPTVAPCTAHCTRIRFTADPQHSSRLLWQVVGLRRTEGRSRRR